MARLITQLTAAGALTGTELVWVEQGGLPRKATTQAIADLAAAGSEINDLTAAVVWANIPIANVPTGTTGSTVALGNHTHDAASITAGNLISTVLPFSTASTANSAFKIPFLNTTGVASGNFGLQLDDTAAQFTYNPSTNILSAPNFAGAGASITALTAANISAGNLGTGVIPHSAASTTSSAFKVAFVNTTANASGNFGRLHKGTNGFTFNPSTSTLAVTNISMSDGLLERAHLDDFAVLHQTLSPSGATQAINYELGQSVTLSPTSTGTLTISFSNWPASGRLGQIDILFIQAATARALAWPATVNWPNGTAPDVSVANARYLIHLRTVDAGGTHIEGTYTPAMS